MNHILFCPLPPEVSKWEHVPRIQKSMAVALLVLKAFVTETRKFIADEIKKEIDNGVRKTVEVAQAHALAESLQEENKRLEQDIDELRQIENEEAAGTPNPANHNEKRRHSFFIFYMDYFWWRNQCYEDGLALRKQIEDEEAAGTPNPADHDHNEEKATGEKPEENKVVLKRLHQVDNIVNDVFLIHLGNW